MWQPTHVQVTGKTAWRIFHMTSYFLGFGFSGVLVAPLYTWDKKCSFFFLRLAARKGENGDQNVIYREAFCSVCLNELIICVELINNVITLKVEVIKTRVYIFLKGYFWVELTKWCIGVKREQHFHFYCDQIVL